MTLQKNLKDLEQPFCDWLSFTINPEYLKDIFIFGNKQIELKSWNSYDVAYFTNTGVLIAYSPSRPELRLFCSLSSKALYSQSLKLEDIIDWAIPRGGKFTRIDIAKDDYSKVLDLDIIYNKIKTGELVTRFRNFSVYEGEIYSTIESGKIGSNTTAKTIYLGNLKKSNVIVRIYDKGAKEKTNYSWIRVEYQLRHEVSDQYCHKHLLLDPDTGEIKKTSNSVKKTLGDIRERDFPSIANYYLRFLDPTKNKKGELIHKRHWHTSHFWEKFIGTTERNTIGLPKYKTGLEDLRKWATRSISGINYLLEQAYGEDYKKERREKGKENFQNNKYYQELIKEKKK